MKKIGIIGAMDLEVATLKAAMTDVRITNRIGLEFYEGTLNGAAVVVVRSGIGKVNAALCVQVLADLFAVTHIINTGIAGSLDARLDIGDLAVSTDLMYHDFHVAPFGYVVGQVPDMDVHAFPADARMAELAEKLCHEHNIRCCRGRIVSGDRFIAEKTEKQQIIENVGGLCTEMEGAAIAHAAYVNGLPVLVLRAISDKADDSADMDYPTFERMAAEQCAALVRALVEQM